MKYKIKKLNEHSIEYTKVYRGIPKDSMEISPNKWIWVSEYEDFAEVYGEVIELLLPNDLNILDVEYQYVEWEELCEEFDVDSEDILYNPTDEFIQFLEDQGYDGFKNDENILIFDKDKLIKE